MKNIFKKWNIAKRLKATSGGFDNSGHKRGNVMGFLTFKKEEKLEIVEKKG